MDPTFTFSTELRPSDTAGGTWVFATVPLDESDEIKELIPERRGFGSVRVRARVEATEWSTSVFPDSKSGCFVLPVKRSVRDTAGIDIGDQVTVELALLIT